MKKLTACLLLAAPLLAAPGAFAQTLGTQWTGMSESLTQLLNSGWTIVSHNNYETEMFSENVTVYSFVVTKDGKYAVCELNNPGVTNTNPKKGRVASSYCIALN